MLAGLVDAVVTVPVVKVCQHYEVYETRGENERDEGRCCMEGQKLLTALRGFGRPIEPLRIWVQGALRTA